MLPVPVTSWTSSTSYRCGNWYGFQKQYLSMLLSVGLLPKKGYPQETNLQVGVGAILGTCCMFFCTTKQESRNHWSWGCLHFFPQPDDSFSMRQPLSRLKYYDTNFSIFIMAPTISFPTLYMSHKKPKTHTHKILAIYNSNKM